MKHQRNNFFCQPCNYDDASAHYDDASAHYDDASAHYDDASAHYDDASAHYDDASAYYDDASTHYDDASAHYDDASAHYDDASAHYDDTFSQFDDYNRQYDRLSSNSDRFSKNVDEAGSRFVESPKYYYKEADAAENSPGIVARNLPPSDEGIALREEVGLMCNVVEILCDGERAVFGFVVNVSGIFANHAAGRQLHPAATVRGRDAG